MTKKYINISKGQFLQDVLTELPSNAIIRKNITGIGATTFEIESERNSIIILPNLPVIFAKEHKHKNCDKRFAVMGVHGDRTSLEVIEFLSKNKNAYKKFLVTPESYFKLIECFKNQLIDYKKEYFLLFDECDRICKDIDYRKTISLPMYDFFSFDNKAFISATAMNPRDKRFTTQNFEFLEIIPSDDLIITQDIKIYKTNNSLEAFSYLYKQDIVDKNYFVFCNSINMITHLITANNLHDCSTIYCSSTSKDKLKRGHLHNVYDKLDETKYSKFNFFTSRYFSAIDMNFNEDVEIYLITDLGIAEYTMIDPATDAIQIIGRFRDKKIKKSVKVLITEEPNLCSMNEEECLTSINHYEFCYKNIETIGRTLPDNEFKGFMKEVRKSLDYNRFMFIDGKTDFFKVDNFIYKNLLNKHYQKFDNVIEEYKNLKIGNTEQSYFNVKYVGSSNSEFSSANTKLFTNSGQKLKTIIKEIVLLLDNCQPKEQFEISNSEDVKNKLKELYPDIVLAYDIVDRDILLLIEKPLELEREIRRAIVYQSSSNLSFLQDLKVEFIIGEKLMLNVIKDRFKKLIDKYSLRINATKINLEKYIIFRRTEINGATAYKVIGYINNS